MGGIFLITQLVTGIALSVSGARSAPLISGTILPISTAFLVLFLVLGHVNDLFLLALRLGQTRRRALGLTLTLCALEGAGAAALSALLAWIERALLPALWLALSGAERLMWGEVPPLPAVWDGTDQGWQALLDELSSTLYLDSFALDWWWCPLLLAIGLAGGAHPRGLPPAVRGQGGLDHLEHLDGHLPGAPAGGEKRPADRPVDRVDGRVGLVFAWLAGIWSVWSLLHAVVKG